MSERVGVLRVLGGALLAALIWPLLGALIAAPFVLVIWAEYR